MRVRLTKTAPKCAFAHLEPLIAGLILTVSSAYAATICPMFWTQVQLEADLQNRVLITSAVDRWYLEKGTWPQEDLSDLAADPEFLSSGVPRNPHTGKPYQLDPVSHRVQR
jgi:hypothetical protein